MTPFRAILPEVVRVEEDDPRTADVDLDALYPGEAERMAKAIVSRQREFALGRALARRAMGTLGVGPLEIPMGADRAPVWPAGIVGSITHTKTWCAAAVAPARQVRAVGIDVENAEPLAPKLWESICTPRDLAWLAARASDERGRLAKAIFSAKECAYKAQYLVTQQFLGFMAMSVEVDPLRGTWRATFEQPSGASFAVGDVIEGSVRWERDVVLTATTLP
ncbi:MAG: 4'-phosphopantetheinyl transferase superfamily protein [Myxococcales bacterium]|nr:4'-phosphopantetheinyl transferase superfamily protein [Myxococcales bacterium]